MVTASPSVTICICTRNRAALLRTALEALLDMVAQSSRADDPALDLLVIDNASTDNTKAVVEQLRLRDARLRYVLEPTLGITPGRNRALNVSTSDIVVFVDDDETVCAGLLDAYIAVFAEQPQCAAAGGVIDLNFEVPRPNWLHPSLDGYLSAYEVPAGESRRLPPKAMVPVGGNLALRRQVALDLGGFDPRLGRVGKNLLSGEETEFLDRLRANGREVWVTPDARVLHLVPRDRATVRWIMRRVYAQGKTDERMDPTNRLVHAVAALLVGGLKYLVTTWPPRSATFVRYLAHRAYRAGQASEILAVRYQRFGAARRAKRSVTNT